MSETRPNTTRLTRHPDVVARDLDDSVFLVGRDNDAVFHLNAIGAAIWKLLAEPVSEEETIALVTEAFPDIPAEQVSADVRRLFRDLDERGFLVTAE